MKKMKKRDEELRKIKSQIYKREEDSLSQVSNVQKYEQEPPI